MRRRRGFTFLELLAVVSILAILLGIVLGAVFSAQRYSRKALAAGEVRTIEHAFQMYYQHYGTWKYLQQYLDSAGDVPIELGGSGDSPHDRGFLLDNAIAEALSGNITGDIHDTSDASSINPDGIPFLEFSRYAVDKNHDGGSVSSARYPANPWAHTPHTSLDNIPSDATPAAAPGDVAFRVLIDSDYTGRFGLNGLGGDYRFPPARVASPDSDGETVDTVARTVLVWTYDPTNDKKENYAIVSWSD